MLAARTLEKRTRNVRKNRDETTQIRLTYCYRCSRVSFLAGNNAAVAVPFADTDPYDNEKSTIPANTSPLKS